MNIIFLGPIGSDAGGTIIVPDGKGGFVVKKVPGWSPEQLRDLAASLKVLTSAASLQAHASAGELVNHAAKVATEHVGAFLQFANAAHAGAGAAAGANTVIVLAH